MMAYRLKVEPEAELDLFRAFRAYETVRRGLGRRFVARVQDVIDRIVMYPEIHAITHKNVRQTLVRKFPYTVCYILENETVSVLAVFHTSREPKGWQSRAE
jgi:plasmid stabilization system protein ParE